VVNHSAGKTFAAAKTPSAAATTRSAPTTTPARLVHHASELVLATPELSLQRVANAVVAETETQRGVVASSSVILAGSASRASFSLRVPSRRLAALLSALSSLAGVRSFTQQTNDITLRYDRESSLLAREHVQRTQLLAQLATTTATAKATTLRRRLGGLEHRMAAHRHLIAVARGSAATARLTVSVVAAAAAPTG
jgi:hypothetical protein